MFPIILIITTITIASGYSVNHNVNLFLQILVLLSILLFILISMGVLVLTKYSFYEFLKSLIISYINVIKGTVCPVKVRKSLIYFIYSYNQMFHSLIVFAGLIIIVGELKHFLYTDFKTPLNLTLNLGRVYIYIILDILNYKLYLLPAIKKYKNGKKRKK